MLNTLVSAIVSGVGVIVVAALVIITMAVCFVREPRGHTQKTPVSVATPVIDICRPPPPNVDQDLAISEPRRPLEVYVSTRKSSPSIGTISRYEDALPQTGLHIPSDHARSQLDVEAQSWKSTRGKRNTKAEWSHSPFCVSPSLEFPISPPPSYSQIDKSLLVAVL